MELNNLMKALADPSRLRLANVLMHQELNVGELVDIFGMGQPRVSRHLKLLTDAGLLEVRRDGLWAFYKARETGEGRQVLDALSPLMAKDPGLKADVVEAHEVAAKRRADSKRFFDAIASDWQSLRAEVLGELDLGGEVESRMPRVATAADLGCGDGGMIPHLLAKAERAIGVDGSRQMLSQAGQRLDRENGRVSLRIGELEHLPLADGEADFALASLVLHHLPEPLLGFREAARALAPGGRLLVVEFAKHGKEAMRQRYGDHWLGFSAAELSGWAQGAGLKKVETARFKVRQGLTVQLLLAAKPL